MVNQIENIDMLKFRGNKSSVYTGRPQGEAARGELNLTQYDTKDITICFNIPKGTTTITPSFFLGLLFESIKKLGFEKYKAKYQFKFLDDNKEVVRILESDVEDSERHAVNTLKGKRGIDRFLSSKKNNNNLNNSNA